MATRTMDSDLCVVFSVSDQQLAVPVDSVREMVPRPKVVAVPRLPAHVMGVINLRGMIIPLFDLRTRLGFTSCADERLAMVAMLKEREQDHLNWLAALEAAVDEGREFNLATDPHKCAFGKWYYAYNSHTSISRCLDVESLFKKFEEPHNKIHGVAEQALALAGSGDMEAARDLINLTRDTVLAEMIKIFKESYQVLAEARRELVMVIGSNQHPAALTVDTVEAVERVTRAEGVSATELGMGADDPMISAVGKRGGDQSLVLLLDVSEFYEQAQLLSAA